VSGEVSSGKTEEKALQVIASRQGVDPEVLSLVASVIQGEEDEVSRTVSTIATAGEALSKANPQVAQPLSQLLGAALVKQLNTDPVQQRIIGMVSAIAAAKSLLGGDETTKLLMEQLNRLQQRLEEITEAKNKEEVQKILDDVASIMEKMHERIEALEKKIEEVKSTPPPQQQPREPLDDVMKYADQLAKMKATVQALAEAFGAKVVHPGSEGFDPDAIEKFKKKLEELGFEVRPRTMTLDEYRRRLQLMKKKYERKLKEKLEKYEKIKELEARKTESLAAVAIKLLGVIESIAGGRSSSGELLNQLIEAGQGGQSGSAGAVQQAQ